MSANPTFLNILEAYDEGGLDAVRALPITSVDPADLVDVAGHPKLDAYLRCFLSSHPRRPRRRPGRVPRLYDGPTSTVLEILEAYNKGGLDAVRRLPPPLVQTEADLDEVRCSKLDAYLRCFLPRDLVYRGSNTINHPGDARLYEVSGVAHINVSVQAYPEILPRRTPIYIVPSQEEHRRIDLYWEGKRPSWCTLQIMRRSDNKIHIPLKPYGVLPGDQVLVRFHPHHLELRLP